MYDNSLIIKLLSPGKIVDNGRFTVEIKDVPDKTGEDMIDPRYYEFQMKAFGDRMSNPGVKPSLERQRASAGTVTQNLCTAQIRTRYHEAETEGGTVPVWEYYPRFGVPGAPALIYLHGGGFYLGSCFDTENVARYAAEQIGGPVFNVDYSLAPEAQFPTQPKQCYGVLKYVHEHAEELGIDPEKIYIAGDSAGANLSLVTALMDRDQGTHYLAGQILVYPTLSFTHDGMEGYAYDLEQFTIAEEHKFLLPMMAVLGGDMMNQVMADYYGGGADLKDPYLCPAFADVEGLPEVMLITSEYDGLRLEDEYFCAKLEAAGVPYRYICYRGMGHGFLDRIGTFPQSEAVIREMGGYIKLGRLKKGLTPAQKAEAAARRKAAGEQGFEVASY